MNRSTLLLLAAFLLPATVQAEVCETEAHLAEQSLNLPSNLLLAIGRVESGRRTGDGRVSPWPWSVNAAGEGHFLASAAEAIDLVRSLQARGIRSIDVGCFQVNLLFHPEAFGSLSEAFDPAHNATAAARFLVNLHGASTDWNDAIARYHSADPAFGVPYLHQVLASWHGGADVGGRSLSQVAALVRVIVPGSLKAAETTDSVAVSSSRGGGRVFDGRLPIVIVPSARL